MNNYSICYDFESPYARFERKHLNTISKIDMPFDWLIDRLFRLGVTYNFIGD